MGKRTATGLMVGLAVVLWPSAATAGGGGCHGDLTQGRGDTVVISKACFRPSILRTDPGTEVAFVNRDPIPHNVVAPRWGHYDNLGEGEGFTARFEDEGIYPFACTLHPGMTGAVVVGDGTGAGSGASVTVESAFGEIPHPASKPAVATAPASSSQAGSPIGWVGLGAAAGLVAGGTMALLRRRRSA